MLSKYAVHVEHIVTLLC